MVMFKWKKTNEQTKGNMEEESYENPTETRIVLWDMFPSINLTKNDERLEETLVVRTISKGTILQTQIDVP
jgi:hypothetical protein